MRPKAVNVPASPSAASASASSKASTASAGSASSAESQALHEALATLMAPLAQLAVARGLPFAAVEEMLKTAFVQVAGDAHPGLLAHRKVSRISTATGINRREVTRLTQVAKAPTSGAKRGRSLTSELFTHWRTHSRYRDGTGEPLALPRQGPAPSFEALAQAITRDVHPRSLLDELCRLGLAQVDASSDTVSLVKAAFVPRGDRVRMLGFLGDNVGDHLRAAVDNVLGHGTPHFEQALFADGLSSQSLEALRPLLNEHWRALRAAFVPRLEALIAADAASPQPAHGRIRLGLYSLHAAEPEAPPPAARSSAQTDLPKAPKLRKPRKPGPQKSEP